MTILNYSFVKWWLIEPLFFSSLEPPKASNTRRAHAKHAALSSHGNSPQARAIVLLFLLRQSGRVVQVFTQKYRSVGIAKLLRFIYWAYWDGDVDRCFGRAHPNFLASPTGLTCLPKSKNPPTFKPTNPVTTPTKRTPSVNDNNPKLKNKI